MNNNNFEQNFQSNPYSYGSYNTPPIPPAEFFEKKAVRKTGTKVGISLIFFFASTLIISIIIGFFSYILGNTQWLNDKFSTLIVNIAATVIGFLGGGLLLSAITKGKKLISYSLPQKGTLLPLTYIGIGFCYTANMAVSLMQSNLSFLGELKGGDFDAPSGIFGFLFTVLAVAVFPAFLEEFFFRGVILGSLVKFGKPFAIFTSAVIFGLIHGNLIQIPFAFLVGLVLAFAVLESGSLWAGILIHFINNFLSICFKYLQNYANERVMNILFSLVILAAIGLGFLGLYLLCIRNKDLFNPKKTAHTSTSAQRFWWFISSPPIITALVFVFLEILLNQFMPAV